MKGTWAIFRKEMQLYFVSPIAYTVVGIFLIVTGIYFQGLLDYVIRAAQQQAIQAMRYGTPPEMDMPGVITEQFFGFMATVLLFLVPMTTMGLYAEERKRGTMELLMTSPVTDLDIVLGKFLGSLALLGMMLLPTALELVVLYRISDPAPPWRILLAGYIGMLLLGGALLAIGTFVSSLTENQIIAGAGTFGLSIILLLLDLVVRGGAGSAWSEVPRYLSILRHNEDFIRGVVDTSHLIYYASVIALGLFLTMRSLDSMRWRRA